MRSVCRFNKSHISLMLFLPTSNTFLWEGLIIGIGETKKSLALITANNSPNKGVAYTIWLEL